MRASEIIARVRSLARDTDIEDLRFGDGEILECVSHAQSELVAEFGENIHIYTTKAKQSLELPSELGKIYSITLDGRQLDRGLFGRALGKERACFTHYGGRRYGVLGLKGQEGVELVITASFLPNTLESPRETLQLGESYKQALSLLAYCELLLIETNAQNLQKLQFYRAELEREKAKIRANKNRSMNAGTIETKANA